MLALLQTKMVLTRPWVLMELFYAMRHRIPIIPLRIEGRGYDYFEAQVFLANLEIELEEINPGSVNMVKGMLAYEGIAFPTFQHALCDLLPQLISIGYDPEGSDAHINAVVADLVKKG